MKKKFVLFMLIATMSTMTILSGCSDKKIEKESHSKNEVKTEDIALDDDINNASTDTDDTDIELSMNDNNDEKENENKAKDKISKPSVSKNTTTKPTDKPTNKPNKPSEKPNSKPSKPDSKPNNKPSDKHEHSWKAVYETVHHKEEGHYEKQMVEEAWTEEIWEEHTFCNVCKQDITASGMTPVSHMNKYHVPEGNAGGWHNKQVLVKTIPHDPIYEDIWVVDKPAWTEQKKTHEECSCGARR